MMVNDEDQVFTGVEPPGRRTMIFQHIPKTAGSTLHTILNRKYRFCEIYNIFAANHEDESAHELRALPEARRRQIDLLKGHMPFGLHRDLPQECLYVTVLRDPISRVISQYKYIRKNPANHLHDEVVGNDLSLGEFVSSGISVGMDNGQVRWLAGGIHDCKFGEVGEEELEQAKEHLQENYALVGITKEFDATVIALQRLLGWSIYPFYVKRNVSDDQRTKMNFGKGDIEDVRRHHDYDLQLYDFARNLFESQRKQLGVSDEDVRRFVRWNRVYSEVVRPMVRITGALKRRI